MGGAWGWFLALHRDVYLALAPKIAEMGSSGSALALSVVLAFTLGMLHALTQGHGKIVVFSYFFGRAARPWQGMAVALEIAFVHVLAGIAVFVTLAFVIGKTFGYPLRDLPLLTIASNVAIAAAADGSSIAP